MKGVKALFLLLVLLYISSYTESATLDVSLPDQLTEDIHYEKSPAIIYDGVDYRLFYIRSASVTGSYQNGNPDVGDYQIYYKQAGVVDDLTDAVAQTVPGADNISGGIIRAVYYDGEPWVFGIQADTLFGWYYNGSSWSRVMMTADMPAIGAGHAVTVFQDTLIIAYTAASSGSHWHTIRTTDPKNTGTWSSPLAVESSLTGGSGCFYAESGQLYIAISASNTILLKRYDQAATTWVAVDQTSAVRTYGISLVQINGQYLLFQTAMPLDFSYRWLAVRAGTSLTNLLGGPTPIMIEQSSFNANTWTSMQPHAFVDQTGDAYLLYTSERSETDPGTDNTGNIWFLKLDWFDDRSLTDNHYTFIEAAIEAAAVDDQIRIRPGRYINDFQILDKRVVLLGPHADVDPYGTLDRADEACLIRTDGGNYNIHAGASGAVINGFKFGDTAAGSGRGVIVNGAGGITIGYNIFADCAGGAVTIGQTANNAAVIYNRIDNSRASSILDSAGGAVINHNHITNQIEQYAVFTTGRALITGNTITNGQFGIGSEYDGESDTDRVEISGNTISHNQFPGIITAGEYTYIYNNTISHCNNLGEDINWDLASIHIEADAGHCRVEANTVYNGIGGIQIWADSVTVAGNIIYAMGADYPDEVVIGERTYKNSAVIVGTNWSSGNHYPDGVIVHGNHIATSNYHSLFHNQNMFRKIDASCNWWGDSLSGSFLPKIGHQADYSPWLGHSDDDEPGLPGFQGDFGSLWVDDDSPQSDRSGYINEALDTVFSGGFIHVREGIYEENLAIGNYYELETPGSAITGDTETVILLGPQAYVDPVADTADRPGGEALILGRIKINTDGFGAVVNGFKIDGSHTAPDKSPIFIQHSREAEISYNIIINAQHNAIENGFGIDDAPGTIVRFNVIDHPDKNGIYNYSEDDGFTTGNANLQITNNYLTNTTWHGIYLPATGADHIVTGNYLYNCGTQGVGFFPIYCHARSVIEGNTIDSCRNGILAAYGGTGIGDRMEIIDNSINNIIYPGIVIGDFDDSTNTGAHTYLYNNSVSRCNHTGHISTDNWQYGSIMIMQNATGTIAVANTINDGVKGITYWADSVVITNNKIYDMGKSYPDEELFNGDLYLNCALQHGSFYSGDSEIYQPEGVTIFENSLGKNAGGLFYPVPQKLVNASGNWWGNNNADSVAFQTSDSIDYTPWLSLGSDIDPDSTGYQGFYSVLWVDDDSPQADSVGRIQEAIDMVTGSTVWLVEGVYHKPFSIENRDDMMISGIVAGTVTFQPDTTISWDIDSSLNHRQTTVRVVDADNVSLKRIDFDFEHVKGDNVYGLLYWNAAGLITLNTFDNMNAAGNHEYVGYFRAPDYNASYRAEIEIHNNSFYRTGRLAILAHDYVDLNIHDNLFDKIDEDFGYGIGIGTVANAVIRNNEFANYKTWSSTDQYTVSAIYLENTNTVDVGPLEKTVVIDSNDVHDCQYGIIAGNLYTGTAGDVDINLTVRHNQIYDNNTVGSYSSGGIILTDEGKDQGSSLTAIIDSNIIANTGDNGIYIYTNGNGDMTATITNNWIVDNVKGIVVKDYALPSSSSYNLQIYRNIFDNNLNAENDAVAGYWDDGDAVGNCWSDYTGPGAYTVPGSAGAIDRFPNVECGDCIPGDANDNVSINILDITYLIEHLYQEGPPPIPYETCSGDPNTDCIVNILDITYLIEFLYLGGPAPGTVVDWFSACGGPIRKP